MIIRRLVDKIFDCTTKITILQILLGLSIKSEIFVKTTKTIVFLFILLYKTFMYLMQFDLLVAKVGDKTMSTNNLWENKLDNAKRTVTKQLSTLGLYLIYFFCKHNFVNRNIYFQNRKIWNSKPLLAHFKLWENIGLSLEQSLHC